LSNSPSLRRHSRTSSQRSAARIFVQAPGAPAVSANSKERKADGRSAPPGKNRGRAGRQGSGTHAKLARSANLKCSDPRTSTPRDIEACRNPKLPQVRQTPRSKNGGASRAYGVPRAVFEVCSAKSPAVGRSRPAVEDRALGRHSPDRRIRPTGHQGPRRNVDAPGRFAAWTAGPLHRISDAQDPGHRFPPRVWRR